MPGRSSACIPPPDPHVTQHQQLIPVIEAVPTDSYSQLVYNDMLFIIQSMAVQNSVRARTQHCRTPVVVVVNGEENLPPFLILDDVPV